MCVGSWNQTQVFRLDSKCWYPPTPALPAHPHPASPLTSQERVLGGLGVVLSSFLLSVFC